ncbi:hypothetical protein, partial [Actinomadura kijaniata]|uniref:hypothetical protein n=1 Tax=Actinomadura kijaniata TaxID=46161 RepID=UPI00157D52B6
MSLGAERHRVIRPAKPLNNAALHDHGFNHYDMYVDRADGRRAGTLWLLAARSPRSMVYLPMRATPHPPDIGCDWFPEGPLDLVLLHHSLQFPPSRWKRVRERITRANTPRELRTAGVPDSDLPTDEEVNYPAFSYQENRDVLRQHRYAETLFLTGSAAAFREAARHFFAVAKHGPPAAARDSLYLSVGCNYHVCRQFYWPHIDPRGNREIHFAYCPTWTLRPPTSTSRS